MAVLFGDVWRLVRLHAPGVPFGLVREWTQQAYAELVDRRPWSWAQTELTLSVLAARSLTVTVVQGSKAITSAAGFLSTDAGRQIRVGTFPVYTIDVVTDASNATLTVAYAGTGGALTAQILDAYVTLPADFASFIFVADPYNQRMVPYWLTEDQLNRVDPTRSSSDGTPRVLVARQASQRQATLGQMVYEWWPYPTAAKQFPCMYRKAPAKLLDTDPLLGTLAQHSHVLQHGALMKCAKWPGSALEKNPYFSLALYKEFKRDFEEALAKLELRDDDQLQQSWSTLPYHRWGLWDLTFDTAFLRSHDATLADYISG